MAGNESTFKGGFLLFLILLILAALCFPPEAEARRKKKEKKKEEEIAERTASREELLRRVYDARRAEQVSSGPSLWCGEYAASARLFTDLKAHRPGDLLTVQIIESSTAENSAKTNTGKKSDVSAGIPNFFGFEVEARNHITKGFDPDNLINGSYEDSFKGSGTTTRSNKVTAVITAVVVEVLPGDNLVIEGHREITVNSEKHFITIRGIVRPRDISPGNVVLSTSIANLNVLYSGKGPIADKQREGWFLKVLSWLWPF